jgi:surface protein
MMGPAALLCVLSLLEAVTGTALHDGNIRTAVNAWLSNPTAAEAAYGHISTWETGGVTDMRSLFCAYDWCTNYHYAAASFNEDIGAWDTSGVTDMWRMFYGASAFNQDLGWCVDDDVILCAWGRCPFDGTSCWSTSCGVLQGICDYPMTDSTIRTAVTAWLSNPTAAEATYGHISTWETGGVTDMSYLFCESTSSACNTAAASFNDDISSWETSGVTTMRSMFTGASAFNRDIGAWDTSGVTSMRYMFYEASAFDQDLGWCVDDDVGLDYAFKDTPCASTSCGVKQVVDACAPTPRPTPRPTIVNYVMTDSTIKTAVAAWFDDRSGAEATYGHISTWETGGVTDDPYR